MTRRLATALLVFTAIVLLLSVVPLGSSTSVRDRNDFSAASRAAALSLATLAEDSFDKHGARLTSTRLAAAAGAGVSATIVDQSGRVVLSAGPPRPLPLAFVRRALAQGAVSANVDDDVYAAAPVVAEEAVRGVVVTARPDEPVERRIVRLWAVLAGVALLALLASVALAVGAARWVTRPLRRLQETAHQWSDGSLHERADPLSGPPEVREVAAALNVMAARLDTLVHGSRAVVADVSHQLRTPLAAMRLRLDLVRDELVSRGAATGTVEEDLALALAEVDRLSRLVDGLLTVARAEATEAQSQPVDAAAIVRERRLAWQPVAAERGVAIEVEVPDEPVTASATPGHLEQILDNLVDNSLEALPDGGQVVLSVQRVRDRVVVEVRDDGVGMTEEQQEGAFRRFVSGRQESGSGLGLAVVHRLVTADGGSVHLDSRPGRGTAVTFELPAARRGGDDRQTMRTSLPTTFTS